MRSSTISDKTRLLSFSGIFGEHFQNLGSDTYFVIIPLRYYRGQSMMPNRRSDAKSLAATRIEPSLQYALYLTHRLFGTLAKDLSMESESIVTVNYFEDEDLLAIAVPTLPAEMQCAALPKCLRSVTGKSAVFGLYESCLHQRATTRERRIACISIDRLESMYWEASIQIPAPESRGYNQLLGIGRLFIGQVRVATEMARKRS